MTYELKIKQNIDLIKNDKDLSARLLEVQKDTLLMALDDGMEDYFITAINGEFGHEFGYNFPLMDALHEYGWNTLSDAC